jgi:hypothetical protein
MKEFRFGVGNLLSRRSTIWKVWTSGDEAYLQTRMMGSSTKVSLHGDGACQWSFDSVWYGANRAGQRNADRHITRWTRPPIEKDQAAHVFRIIIPETELREAQTSESIKNVTWIPAPSSGNALIVECYMTPPVTNEELKFPFPHLASLELAEAKKFVLLRHEEIISEVDKGILTTLREQSKKFALASSIQLKPEYRGVGFVAGEHGERGMIEYVPLE